MASAVPQQAQTDPACRRGALVQGAKRPEACFCAFSLMLFSLVPRSLHGPACPGSFWDTYYFA